MDRELDDLQTKLEDAFAAATAKCTGSAASSAVSASAASRR